MKTILVGDAQRGPRCRVAKAKFASSSWRQARMKSSHVVRTFYVLPCCLLLLNLCIELVSYKAKMIDDVLLRTTAIMSMVLFGGSLVAFLVAPAIGLAVGTMQRSSRREWGGLGELLFLLF